MKNNLFPFSFINIVGPTCAGKTEMIKRFRKRFPQYLGFPKSCTTRAPEPGEIEEGLYEFISEEEFMTRVEKGLFFEWNKLESNGHLYGTLWSEYYRLKDAGQIIIKDLDNNGSANVKKVLGHEIFNVYLLVSDEELRRRMYLPSSRVRDNPEGRLEYAKKENEFAQQNIETVFDLILLYDYRTIDEGITVIMNKMRHKRMILANAA